MIVAAGNPHANFAVIVHWSAPRAVARYNPDMQEPTGLQQLVKFIDFTHTFQKVLRTNRAAGGERRENDAEHSYQLALVAWFLNDSLNLQLDTGKTLRYALAHDLVEAYAGDTDPHYSASVPSATKEQREETARVKLIEEFPGFPALHSTIEEYETSKRRSEVPNRESQLVYALDKLLVFVNMYLTTDPYYVVLEHVRGITMLDDMNATREKVLRCEPVRKCYDELMHLLGTHLQV